MAKKPAKIIVGRHGTLRPDFSVATALGEMTARWSHLEFLLMQALKKLTDMSTEDASAIMFSVNATSARVDIVQSVAQRRPKGDPLRKAIMAATAPVVQLMSRRNALTHHVWFSETHTGKIYTFDYRQDMDKPQGIAKRQTAHAIKKFCDEITDACQALSQATGSSMPDALIAAHKMPFTISRARKSAKG